MTAAAPVVFTPGLESQDPLANYYLRQATLRLRRELCWLWQDNGALLRADRVIESLDRARFFARKHEFWHEDVTARYLTAKIFEPEPSAGAAPRGSFGWVAEELPLDSTARLALALALVAAFDSGAGPVIGACLNDAQRTLPTLALLQNLCDDPTDALSLTDPAHPLFAFGLLRRAEGLAVDWDAALSIPESIARKLLYPVSALPRHLQPVSAAAVFPELEEAAAQAVSRIRQESGLCVVHLLGGPGAATRDFLGTVSRHTGRPVQSAKGLTPAGLPAALTLCWLEGCDLFLPSSFAKLAETVAASHELPVTLFVQGAIEGITAARIEVPAFPFAHRLEAWRSELGGRVDEEALAETARRFRFDSETIQRVAGSLRRGEGPVTRRTISAACRSARSADLGELAQRVRPRFHSAAQLVLPVRQREHFEEVLHAIRALTAVHYRWGTERVWNEGGIPVLFAGPPGTGKTMGAEILASELDLPMYRIDLSQVVNKYIGETEKNLKRIFDAADVSDTLLLFDEADAIFGKRMEARDAQDRWANLEISYLLERMERFKGVAVLATNRKKDLDDAFLRRLRYIVDFPLPGAEERRRIWEQALPGGVDHSALDLELLASRFAISGGHIRSVVFNACLQSARPDRSPRLEMKEVVVALKRELDKLNRPVALESFGPFASVIQEMEDGGDTH